MKHYILQEFQNLEYIIVLVRNLKYPKTVLDTSRPTELSTEDEKYPIIAMIQTEDIKQYVKKYQPYEKYNQALWANLGTVLPITPDLIGWIPRIYHQVANIKLPLAIHKVQDVYIWHQSYLKWL